MEQLPSKARAVVIGGGIAGCSVAYHLALRGVTDVVLLERKQLTSGTTWHAAGLVGQVRESPSLTRLSRYSVELYSSLAESGFKQVGSVGLATNAERLHEFKRVASSAQLAGLEANLLTPQQAQALWPLMRADDVVGAIHIASDAKVDPKGTALSLADEAIKRGVRIFEDTRVTGLIVENGRVLGVRTSQAEIHAEFVVLAAGIWGHSFGASAETTIPLHAAEHVYAVSEPIPGLPETLPILRDSDASTYIKEDKGRLMFGWFGPVAKPWGMEGIPESFSFDRIPNDFEHLEPLLEAARHRVPVLRDTEVQLYFNGPESFTPDDRYLLGETAEIKNLFVIGGFNSIGIQASGGAGKALADWVVDGYPSVDLWDVDILRYMPFQRNSRYLRERAVESLGVLYAIHWPYRQMSTARGVRRSVLHDRLAAKGACFGEVAGWERPNWYAPEGTEPSYKYTYGRPNWFEYSGEEHHAVRNAAGLFDQSSFAKFEVAGADAETVLNRILANDVGVEVGTIVYSQALNDRGGIEADVTVTRLAEDRFLIVTSAAMQTHDWTWLHRSIPTGARVAAFDATSAYVVLGLMGPHSRELLSRLTNADLSNEGFPFASSRVIDLGLARVRASRITYVGELGWELYIPTEFAQGVYDEIVGEGSKSGLRLAGYHALNSLRMEKAYRSWGHDISPVDTPLEAGLGFAVAWEKPGGFVGREALLRQKEQGVKRRLAQFALLETDQLYHNEPIWRDGRLAGRITSGMFGHTIGKPLGLGYVENGGERVDAGFVEGGSYEIEVAGRRVKAQVTLRPFYDPKNLRTKDLADPQKPAALLAH